MRVGWVRRDRSPVSHSLARLLLGACLMLLCFSSEPAGRAAELLDGPAVTFAEGTRAIIRWKTDVSTGSRVFFGESLQRMTRRGDGGQGIEHEVTLPPLSFGTKWYYTVGTAR